MDHEYKFTLGESLTTSLNPSDPYSKDKQDNYFGAKGDSVEEVVANLAALKAAYKPTLPVREARVVPDEVYDRNLPKRASEAFGKAAKTYDAFTDGLGLKEKCDTCEADMELKWKESKNKFNEDGSPKQYQAWFCPNWKFGAKGHTMKFPKK